MILGIDTETSGLFKDDIDPLDPGQPHMVQLGAQLYDRQWVKRGSLTVLIKPDGWAIESQAEAVHGISTQTCHRYGISVAEALVAFRGLVGAATRIIGHNMQFDRKVIASSIKRAGGEGVWWHRAAGKMLCTMETSTPVLKLPSEFGYKFPSLAEAVTALCPELKFEERHDAEADIGATVALYRALVAAGAVIEVAPFGMKLE